MASGPANLVAGRYQLRRLLGAGGFGEVHLADDRELSRPVALKLLRPDLADREALARFVREARSTAALDHPSIVRVYDHGRTEEGRFFIVYEYVEGTSAAAAARLGPPLEPHRVASLGRDVATALAAAHRLGVLHRDVKPENILLRRDLSPVLADFGIAQLAGDASVRTGTGLILGTPTYLAPEVWRGQAQGPSSDQYALGATLYELLFRTPIHPDPSPSAVARRIGSGWSPEIPPRGAEVRAPGLEAVLARALAPEPGARYPDLAAMAEALAAVSTPSAPWSTGARNPARAETVLVRPGAAAPAPPVDPVPGAPGAGGRVVPLLAFLVLGAGLLVLAPRGGSSSGASEAPSPTGESRPGDEEWATLVRDYRTVLAGFPREAGGRAASATVFDRRREIRTRSDLIGDPRLPLRVSRFLASLGAWVNAVAPGPVEPARRALVREMVVDYLGVELPAMAGIEDELSQDRLKASVGEVLPMAPELVVEPRVWGGRWQEIRLEAERMVRALPPTVAGLEFEQAGLQGLVSAVTGRGDLRAALARLVKVSGGLGERSAWAFALDTADRLLARLVRDGTPLCDLVPEVVGLATREYRTHLPADPGGRRGAAVRGLRLAGLACLACPREVAALAPALEPMVTTLEEVAQVETYYVRREVLELFRSRAEVDRLGEAVFAYPPGVLERLVALRDRLADR